MKTLRLATISALLVIGAASAQAEVLTNQAVIDLAKAGLGPETIVAKVKSSPGKYDVSTTDLINLKHEGVSDSVIAAMLDAAAPKARADINPIDNESVDPLVPHSSGVYVVNNWDKPEKFIRIDATSANQMKSSNIWGYALSYGLSPLKMKAILPTPSARVKVSSARPVFYFYFDQANMNHGGGGNYWVSIGGSVTSPNELSLVRFETSKSDREAVLGQASIGGVKSGVMDKARVVFDYSDVATGVFKVVINQELPPGEYGFVYAASAGSAAMGGGGSARIFDFSVAK